MCLWSSLFVPFTITQIRSQEMLLVFQFFEKLAKTSCSAMPFCSFPSPQKRVKDLFRHEFHRFGAFLCQTNGHCKTNGHAISTCARYFCNSARITEKKENAKYGPLERSNTRLEHPILVLLNLFKQDWMNRIYVSCVRICKTTRWSISVLKKPNILSYLTVIFHEIRTMTIIHWKNIRILNK